MRKRWVLRKGVVRNHCRPKQTDEGIKRAPFRSLTICYFSYEGQGFKGRTLTPLATRLSLDRTLVLTFVWWAGISSLVCLLLSFLLSPLSSPPQIMHVMTSSMGRPQLVGHISCETTKTLTTHVQPIDQKQKYNTRLAIQWQ